MTKPPKISRGRSVALLVILTAMGFAAGLPAAAANPAGLTVTGVVRHADGTTTVSPVTAYRWLVEEDTLYHVPVVGGQPQPDPHTVAVGFHSSYMPVVAKGCVGFEDLPNADHPSFTCDEVPFVPEAGKHYFVSVLPRSGYTIGGAAIAPGQSDVEVYVNALPIPTAQITVFVFEDNFPINNAPDLPAEGAGLAGFTLVIEDAGGRYGQSGGGLSQDAFGNPLGTTYVPGCAPFILPIRRAASISWAAASSKPTPPAAR